MKIKIKKVYYCDFCKKKSLRKDSILNHEQHCTMNPKRDCRLCGKNFGEYNFIPFKLTIEKLEGEMGTRILPKTEEDFKKLQTKIECPICLLTWLRLSGKDIIQFVGWDYKKALKEWWEDKNSQEEGYDYDNR